MNPDNEPKKISTSEKTQAKNAENLHVANTIIESVGVIYNPTNKALLSPGNMTDSKTASTGVCRPSTKRKSPNKTP